MFATLAAPWQACELWQHMSYRISAPAPEGTYDNSLTGAVPSRGGEDGDSTVISKRSDKCDLLCTSLLLVGNNSNENLFLVHRVGASWRQPDEPGWSRRGSVVTNSTDFGSHSMRAFESQTPQG